MPLFDEAYRLAFEEGERFLMGDAMYAMYMAGIVSDLEGEEMWMERLVGYATGLDGPLPRGRGATRKVPPSRMGD